MILLVFVLMAIFAPLIAPGDPSRFVARQNQPPSAEHWLGTTGQGQDVLKQVVWGSRISLGIGFSVGLITTLIGLVIGMVAGYLHGIVDGILNMFTNVFLIIPGLPLLITLASYPSTGDGHRDPGADFHRLGLERTGVSLTDPLFKRERFRFRLGGER